MMITCNYNLKAKHFEHKAKDLKDCSKIIIEPLTLMMMIVSNIKQIFHALFIINSLQNNLDMRYFLTRKIGKILIKWPILNTKKWFRCINKK